MKSAKQIIAELGGPERAAELMGVHRTRVYSWVREDAIPPKRWPAIIGLAEGRITAGDFLPAQRAASCP